MDDVLVSVIIPAYNSTPFIAETIRSVFRQTYHNIEIILIDDGSSDNLAEVATELMKQDSRLHYTSQENLGVSAARNAGFKKSKGEFIAFLDADDVWLPDNILLKIEKFRSGDFGLVHSDAMVINANSMQTGEVMSGREGQLLDDLLSWNGPCIPGPSSILVHRSVVETVGGFDTNLSTSADQDFFFRVASSYSIGRVPKVTWQYRKHQYNMHSNIARMERDVLHVYDKATKAGLFSTREFQRKCYSAMYLILAASWAGDGRNYAKGMRFLFRALLTHPFAWKKIWWKVFSNG